MTEQTIHHISGSVRTRQSRSTIEIAEPIAQRLGITRCVETTWMDRIGLPVYAATRPLSKTTIVTAGKGINREDAHVGALMEGIEQAVAELAADLVEPRWAPATVIAEEGGPTLLSLCPRIDHSEDLDGQIAWLMGTDLAAENKELAMPAELILMPCPPKYYSGIFGSTTTGLASGNTEAEAILHGLYEVLERDTTSFQTLSDTSALVVLETLPSHLTKLHQSIENAGLQVALRYTPTSVGTPYFTALIVDSDFNSPLACHGGYGTHSIAEIAATRALTEAAQSRLSYIQGSRDDLDQHTSFINGMSATAQARYRRKLAEKYFRRDSTIDFSDVPGSTVSHSVPQMLQELVAKCLNAGFSSIGVYRYPPIAHPLHVVRVIMPGAEHFNNTTRRVGFRLAHAERSRRTAAA